MSFSLRQAEEFDWLKSRSLLLRRGGVWLEASGRTGNIIGIIVLVCGLAGLGRDAVITTAIGVGIIWSTIVIDVIASFMKWRAGRLEKIAMKLLDDNLIL